MIEEAIQTFTARTEDTQARLTALLAIVEQFESQYLHLLAETIQDPTESQEIRCAVALVLGRLAGERPVAILQTVCEDTDPAVRSYVIQALGMTHEEAAVPLLIRALKDQDNDIFAAASEALGEVGIKAVPYLIDLLSEGAEDARCVAAWQLGEFGSPVSVPALVKTIRSRPSVSVMALSIWALGEIGLGTDEVLELLSQARHEPEPDVRLRAETALKKIVRHSN